MKKGLLGLTLPILLSLFLMAAVLFVVVVPIIPCKECKIRADYEEALRLDWQTVTVGNKTTVVSSPRPSFGPPQWLGCDTCVGGKRTLLKTWLMRRQQGR